MKKLIVTTIIILFIGAVIAPSLSSISNQSKLKKTNIDTASFDPFEEGWEYRKQITVNHSQVVGNLTNFPLLVSTIDTDLRDKAQTDGDDILFMDDKGMANQVYHEIEYYDCFSGELIVWVSIPSISTIVDTVFYLYYGNLFCANQENPEMVWDSNYETVLHMDDKTSTTIDDSTNNNHDGTKRAPGEPIEAIGKIGKTQHFDGNDDYTDLGHIGTITTSTIEAWFCFDVTWNSTSSGQGLIYSAGGTESDTYLLFYDVDNGKLRYRHNEPDNNLLSMTNSWTNGTWFHIAAIWDGSKKYIYINGVEENNITIADLHLTTTDWQLLGAYKTSDTRTFDGRIDEVRISNNGRNAEWILTGYNNQNNPLNFLDVGSEDMNQPPDAPDIDGPTSGKHGTAYPYTFTSNDSDGDYVSYYIRWGDGNITDWTDFQTSGPPGYIESHSWDTQGTYIIQAKAKDIYGAESDWSELSVTMPRNRLLTNPFILQLLERFPILQRLLSMLEVLTV